MNARCNNESVLLFEKLTPLPLLCVHKHLNVSSLLLNSLLSEKWEALIRSDGMRMGSVWSIEMTHDAVWMELELENAKNESLEICFKEEVLDLQLEMTQDVRVHQENNLLTFYHKTSQHLEASCFKALHLLNFLFPPTSYGHINLSLGSRSPEFPFRFLLQLPGGTAKSVCLHADQEVEGGYLVSFLRNIRVKSIPTIRRMKNLDIGVRIKNVAKCDEGVLAGESNQIQIVDARFLSIDSLKQLNCFKFQAGQNDFSSKDFNEFLRAWVEKRNYHRPSNVSFYIREDQKIKMEEVMEGLNAHVGMPRIRNRWFLEIPALDFDYSYRPAAIDMTDGWDIKNSNGDIGTVLLEPNRLTLVTWPESSFWNYSVRIMERSILFFTRSIQQANKHRELIQKKVDAGKMELFPDQVAYLEEYPEKMRDYQERLALASETKEKLLTVWKEDDAVYVPSPVRTSSSWMRTVIIFGAADIALDSIPLALRFTRGQFGTHVNYSKMQERCKICVIPISDIATTDKFLLTNICSIIYAYSDADSFRRLSQLFIALREKFEDCFEFETRQVNSLLVHLPPGSDRKDNNQPDRSDVERFQWDTWSDAVVFDQNSLTDIEEFVVPIM